MPTALRDVLRSDPATYAGLSDADVVTHLAEVVEHSRDPTRKRSIDVLFALSSIDPSPTRTQYSDLVFGTLEGAAASSPTMARALVRLEDGSPNGGLNFTDPGVIAQVHALAQAGEWPDAARDALLELGVVYRPRWRSLDLAALPTEAEVGQARAENEVLAKLDQFVAAVALGLGDTVLGWDDAVALLPE